MSTTIQSQVTNASNRVGTTKTKCEYEFNIHYFKKIIYTFGRDPKEALFCLDDCSKLTIPIPEVVLSQKIREVDSDEQKIPLLWSADEQKPYLFCTFKGTTIGDWLYSVYNGVNSKITNMDDECKQQILKMREDRRKEYLDKYLRNELTYLDLMGQVFMAGEMKLVNNIWEYHWNC